MTHRQTDRQTDRQTVIITLYMKLIRSSSVRLTVRCGTAASSAYWSLVSTVRVTGTLQLNPALSSALCSMTVCSGSMYDCGCSQLDTHTHTHRHCFNDHFPGGPGLPDTRMSPFWTLLEQRMTEVVSGDSCSYKTCKAPVKPTLPTNQHPTSYRPDALPVAEPTAVEH